MSKQTRKVLLSIVIFEKDCIMILLYDIYRLQRKHPTHHSKYIT